MNIKVIGAGGFGTEIASRMSSEGIEDVSFAAIDIDRDELEDSELSEVLKIGPDSPLGGGAEGNVEMGINAAKNALLKIKPMTDNAEVVVLAAGFGGGTGTGALPLIAKLAHENGCHVCAAVKFPYGFEGGKKSEDSQKALNLLKECTDNFLLFDVKFIVKEGESPHHPEVFGIPFEKTTIKELEGKVSMDGYSDLIYSEVRDYVKKLCSCSDRKAVKEAGNLFFGYTAQQDANLVQSALGGLY